LNFEEIPKSNLKHRRFEYVYIKGGPDDASSGHCSLSSLFFFPEKLVQLPFLQVHLMYLMSTKFDKLILNKSQDIPLCLGIVFTGLLAKKRTWHNPKEATLCSLQLQI
jgi:hypothetical protein